MARLGLSLLREGQPTGKKRLIIWMLNWNEPKEFISKHGECWTRLRYTWLGCGAPSWSLQLLPPDSTWTYLLKLIFKLKADLSLEVCFPLLLLPPPALSMPVSLEIPARVWARNLWEQHLRKREQQKSILKNKWRTHFVIIFIVFKTFWIFLQFLIVSKQFLSLRR